MSSHLEKFVQEHRNAFDDEAPAPDVWDKIRDRIEPGEEKKEAPVRSLPFKRWLAAAAAVVLVAGTGWLYFSLHSTPSAPSVAINDHPGAPDSNRQPSVTTPLDSPNTSQQKIADVQPKLKNPGAAKTPDTPGAAEEAAFTEEMYHYTKLIEIKHNELKGLQKDEPLLYKKFSGDVNKLDSVYHALKIQLPKNSNREQVIEAMISNLQLQIGLLNKQLGIIKQIKHSKKSAYEKAYKSV